MKVELLSITPKAGELCITAARNCYNSMDKSCEKADVALMKSIIQNGHTSILEHASATFMVSDISRVCSHQLVRHRIGHSYAQRSQRYVEEDGCQFIIPESCGTKECMPIVEDLMKRAGKAYTELRKLGVSKEDARFVLPSACSTQIVITMNFRALRHFLKLRLSEKAQWEIRMVAREMYHHVRIVHTDPIVRAMFADLHMLYSTGLEA